MKKLFSYIILLIPFLLNSQSTVSIGTGTSNVYRYPFYGLYDYSHTMFIYTQSEIGGSKDISSIEFNLGDYSTPYTYNNITIKLAHTTDNEFGTNIKVDLTNLNNSDLTTVLSGYNLTISSNGWVEFTFTTNFTYNGTDNLLVIIENRDGSWAANYGYAESVHDNCSCSNDYLSWYKHADGSYPTGYGTRDQSYRPNIKINYSDVLPVELLVLEGEYKDNHNILSWTTASEINNSHFIVKKLINDNYVEVGRVKGKGTTTDLNDYTFIEPANHSYTDIYLIEQVDFNGVGECFGPITITKNIPSNNLVKTLNILGQEVNPQSKGIVYKIYDNGYIEKVYNN